MLAYAIIPAGRYAFSASTSSAVGVTTLRRGTPSRPAWKAAKSWRVMCTSPGAPIAIRRVSAVTASRAIRASPTAIQCANSSCV
jgi:hypothetical protein